MAYNLTPFKPNQPYQDQVDTELKLANANFTTLGQAFMNNDPTQPVLRPVYVNSVAPTNPVASMLWYDTTDKALKLYDGNAWKAVSGASEAQFEELNNDVQSIKSSFLDKDPSKPVIRAVYVGSNAPANPAVGTSWLDTSTSDPVLKVYDGQSWKTALSNTQSVKTALNAEGEAPIYASRAWVRFDGSKSTPTIIASGNVSSVIRNETGEYTINFSLPMPSDNYTVCGVAAGVSNVSYSTTVASGYGTPTFTKNYAKISIPILNRGNTGEPFNSPDIRVSIIGG